MTVGSLQAFSTFSDNVQGVSTIVLGVVLATTIHFLLKPVSRDLAGAAVYIFLSGALQPATDVMFAWFHADGRPRRPGAFSAGNAIFMNSPPSHHEVGGLTFDFERVSGGVIDTYHTQASRTATAPRIALLPMKTAAGLRKGTTPASRPNTTRPCERRRGCSVSPASCCTTPT